MADPYRQFFVEADKDNSGHLTLDELTLVLRKKGYRGTDEEIKAMFGASDNSGDNKISLEEYLIAMGQLPPRDHKAAAMRSAFRAFDKDGSGSIDRHELHAVLNEFRQTYSEADAARLIELGDTDNSGCLNYEEFIARAFGGGD